jgi:hypothetical protein
MYRQLATPDTFVLKIKTNYFTLKKNAALWLQDECKAIASVIWAQRAEGK